MGLVALMLLVAVIVSLMGFRIGFQSGITHAIADSIYYIVDYDGYTDPLGNEYDLKLYIELDDEYYERGMYVC